ncbi:MAG: DUF554 domain-containing protein [Oscillospiraceae bacterium]|nr:DUF554 domain-containing protein [Oscillospiraceae bacterium]
MLAVLVNTVAVLVGSLTGILLKSRLREDLQNAVMKAIALCTAVIGISSAIGTSSILCVIICMIVGTVIGELLKIDYGVEHAGDFIREKLFKGRQTDSRFTEGFVSASILFCVGSMTVMGCLEAGIHRDYSILFAKSTLDLISSMAFGAAMGYGVTCSAALVLVLQGGLTLLAGVVGPLLSTEVVTEMSAVGGVMLIGMALNMLGAVPERIKVANMLPAILVPILYFPIAHLLGA